jgi:YesN/AraC family two-component response regulator
MVRLSQQWSQVVRKESHLPDETDLSTMKNIERLMSEKVYKNTSLSVELLANMLDIGQHNVSKAINRCTKKNFKTYVNEYRIKEMIRLLSEKESRQFSIDALAYEVGFSEIRNFFRVFKKMTGLTPTQFMTNLGKER